MATLTAKTASESPGSLTPGVKVREMSVREFKRHCESMFARANPGAEVFGWVRCVHVTWHDGSRGFSGAFEAGGDGWKPRRMFATYDPSGFMVR